MVQINFAKREVQCKVVYYGPAMSGKTKNLRQIHDRSPQNVRGQLTTIATDTNRTLFFDFLPLNLGLVGNVRTKVNLYAVPFIEAQNALRLLVLEGVDGIVFVADSAPGKLRANQAALENLHENISQLGRELADIPLVFQWNKRDLKEALSVPELAAALNPHGAPAFEAAAGVGAGVFQTLKAITHAVLVDVTKMIVAPSAAASPLPEVASQSAGRIRAVAARDRTPTQVEPEPVFAAAPASEAVPEVQDPTPQPALVQRTAAARTDASFDDVSLPADDAPAAAPEREQGAHETPVTPPWRRAPDRPAVRSQQDEFADHLSTDSFAAHQSPRRRPAQDAKATAGLPERDVPRAADRHPAGRSTRVRRPVETETALEPAATPIPAPEAPPEWVDHTDPKSVDLQGVSRGWDPPSQTGAVRVRGPIGGWDDARRSRDPRPVVDRRKRPRQENVEVLPNKTLWAGSLFSLFTLVVIGYLVHALL